MCRGKVSPDGPIKELTNNPQPIRNIYDVDTQTATYLGSVHHKVRKSTVDPALMVNSANFVSSSSSNNIPMPTLKFLEFVLRQPKLAASLQEFLDNEFCVETLLFIQKVDEYQKQLHEMNLSDEIQRRDLSCFREEILSEFLLATSENEACFVNLRLMFQRKSNKNAWTELKYFVSASWKWELGSFEILASVYSRTVGLI